MALVGACEHEDEEEAVFHWNKQKDINEPNQKAIILYDAGREDLVVQVKYEGRAEDFGWLIPVPALPEVREGSMAPFYELSKLTQEEFGVEGRAKGGPKHNAQRVDEVKVIETKTVGAYEVAVTSAGDVAKLSEWLKAHQFVFPATGRDVLDSYIKKRWYFVAARVIPGRAGFALKWKAPRKTTVSQATRKKLASGELNPLVISFRSEKCVFPLAISAVNAKPSEVSLYVLSAEPLMSRAIFEQRLEAYRRENAAWIRGRPERWSAKVASLSRLRNMEMPRRGPLADPDAEAGDPRPGLAVMRRWLGLELAHRPFRESDDPFRGGGDLVLSMEAGPKQLRDTAKELPRLKGRKWWLTKQVQTFAVAEMRDLEFEPVVPILTKELRTENGDGVTACFAQFGVHVLPFVMEALSSTGQSERLLGLSILASMNEAVFLPTGEFGGWTVTTPPLPAALVAALIKALGDSDPPIREKACEAVEANWDQVYAARVTQLLGDSDEEVRRRAHSCLQGHRKDLTPQLPACRKMLMEDSPGAAYAFRLLTQGRESAVSRGELVRLLSSTNLDVVAMAFGQLRKRGIELQELTAALTNSLAPARRIAVSELARIGNKEAVELIFSRLRDPNEAVRWVVRSKLRRLMGQKIGADPAAWEAWWAANWATFTPPPPEQQGFRRR